MKVPFVDLVKQYNNIKTWIDAAIQDVLDNAAFIGGERVERFERAFAEQHDVEYCIGTSSGTAALHLILWSLGLIDTIYLPVNTFAATAEAAAFVHSDISLVDCVEDYNMSPAGLQTKLRADTERLQNKQGFGFVDVIMPVHLYGQPANMSALMQLAQEHSLIVVEDCCQAHNATYKGQKVGTFGIAGAFSFYPSKNLGAYGDGGAVITNDESLYKEMRSRQNHGQLQKGHHDILGHNYRLDGLQAAVLSVKLQYLDGWTAQRRHIAGQYIDTLKDIYEVSLPIINNWLEHVFHLFVIRVPRRDELRSYLFSQGIETGVHYPIPLHLQKAFAYLGYKKGDFPNAGKYADEILSLPMYPELTEEQINYVAHHIWTFYHI